MTTTQTSTNRTAHRSAYLGWMGARPSLPRPSPAVPIAAAAASLVAFAALATEVREDRTLAIDRTILRVLEPHYFDQPAHSVALVLLGATGDWFTPLPLLIVVAIGIGLLASGRRGDALFLVLAAFVAALISYLLKPLFPQPGLNPGADSRSYFPSGHAMGSLTVVAAVVLLNWHRRYRFALLAAGGVFVFVYGAALVFLREHYPSDVLAGWCLGAAWISVLWLCFGAARRPIAFEAPDRRRPA
jgi:membrane-associated phospholipid phosphatase